MNCTFPINAAVFIQYQEKLCGRSLTNSERDMTIEAVDIINKAYEDGKEGFSTDLYPSNPDDLLNEMSPALYGNHGVRRYLYVLVSLSTSAWERGCKDAEEEVSA